MESHIDGAARVKIAAQDTVHDRMRRFYRQRIVTLECGRQHTLDYRDHGFLGFSPMGLVISSPIRQRIRFADPDLAVVRLHLNVNESAQRFHQACPAKLAANRKPKGEGLYIDDLHSDRSQYGSPPLPWRRSGTKALGKLVSTRSGK